MPERADPGTPAQLDWTRRQAQLAAQLHDTPTGWFDVIRNEYKLAQPSLSQLPDDSALWPLLAYHEVVASKFSSDEMLLLSSAVPASLSRAGGRVVTVHGDLHRANVLRTAAGEYTVIDCEFTCVSSAVHDLSVHMSAQTRRSFAAAYLSHLEGESVDAVQTELLAFDMLIAGIVHFGVLRPTLFWDGTGWNKAKAISLQRALTLLAQLRQIVQAVSEDLSERMVQGCLEGSLCSMLVDRVDSISLFWYEDQFMPSVLT